MKMHEVMDVNARTSRKAPNLSHIEIHEAENGGHIVEHHFEHLSGSYKEPERHVFAEGEGKEALAHIAKHMNLGEKEHEPKESVHEKETAEEHGGDSAYE